MSKGGAPIERGWKGGVSRGNFFRGRGAGTFLAKRSFARQDFEKRKGGIHREEKNLISGGLRGWHRKGEECARGRTCMI